MKQLIIPVLIGLFVFFLVTSLIQLGRILERPNLPYKHPTITSEQDVYQIHLNDSIADVCYDVRHKKVVIVNGYFIEQRCELDSNRYHFNIKINQ